MSETSTLKWTGSLSQFGLAWAEPCNDVGIDILTDFDSLNHTITGHVFQNNSLSYSSVLKEIMKEADSYLFLWSLSSKISIVALCLFRIS